MYVPPSMKVEDETEVRAMVRERGSGWLVTVNSEGEPAATLVPLLWRGDRVVAHVSRANPHWRGIRDGGPGLFIIGGPEAYVSPSWYPSKAEHGRVVPTWNYLAVHLRGAVQVHHDPLWLREVVTALTDEHESGRTQPWHVDDAPVDHVTSLLGAIVGVEMAVSEVVAKAKLSQNRSADDQAGVVAGLQREPGAGAAAVAAAMQRR